MHPEPKNSMSKNMFADHRWLIFTAILLGLLYLLMPILTPFLIAAILAYVCDPLVDKLCDIKFGRFSLSRSLSTALVMLGLLGVVILLLVIFVPLLQKESLLVIQKLPDLINYIQTSIEPWLKKHFGISFAINGAQIQTIITKNWTTVGDLLGSALSMAGTQGMAIVGVLANIILLPVVLFYLLRDWDDLIDKIANLIPLEWNEKTTSFAKEIDEVIASFMRGQLAVMLAMSVFYATGLWLVGFNMALPIGLIAGLFGFVPYLGFGLGVLLALLVGILQFSSIAQAIPVVIVFSLGQVFESMYLTPKLVGERIGLHPVAVIFALMAGGQLFGFVGLLLALPASAAIAVGLRHFKESYLHSDTYLNLE